VLESNFDSKRYTLQKIRRGCRERRGRKKEVDLFLKL
jgi:hypothetical protein